MEDLEELENYKKAMFGEFYDPDKFVFFWNNRNARRKQSGSLIFWFKDFLDKVGHDKATLVMHTEVKDQNGQDLQAIIEELGLTNGQVLFSQTKVPPDRLAVMYNIADCTVNVSDAEGFGLATLESLSCGTPIIVTMTGGLQEQIRAPGDKEEYGVGIKPASKAIIGSQPIPWIYEDRVAGEDVVEAMEKIYFTDPEKRKELGLAGRQHVMKNYNFETFNKTWVDVMTKIYEDEGSWETRKQTKRWVLEALDVQEEEQNEGIG